MTGREKNYLCAKPLWCQPNMFIRIVRRTVLGSVYILLSLLIGECHPFSRVTMYNSFSSSSYAFYLSDSTGRLLPFKTYFDYSADDVGHNYWVVNDLYPDSSGIETASVRYKRGTVLWQKIAAHARTAALPGSMQIHRVAFYLKGDSIAKTDMVIYNIANGK